VTYEGFAAELTPEDMHQLVERGSSAVLALLQPLSEPINKILGQESSVGEVINVSGAIASELAPG
jgi:hypothetical protein